MTTVWRPHNPEATQMWQFMRFVEQKYLQNFTDYHQLHTWSVQHAELFWPALMEFFHLTFDTPEENVLIEGDAMMDARWFEGAKFNFTQKLLPRCDDHPALININEQNQRQVFTYREVNRLVMECAAGLRQIGVGEGDRVAAVMPNVAATIIAMLATAAVGAIWSSCSPDFGITAILDRFQQINPKVLFICDGQYYHGKTHNLLEKIKALNSNLPSLKRMVICPILQNDIELDTLPNTILWDDFLKPQQPLSFKPFPFSHPLYILFSSGTTGKPKCIVHGAGGTWLQHIKELGLHTDLRANDNMCFFTTCGWMMWNWMVSTLAFGATLTLYEGSPTFPDSNRLFQVLQQENVTIFGTSAKFLSSVAKAGCFPNLKYPMSNLRCILSTGSPLLPKQYDFVYQYIKHDVQLSSISGGTDIVSCFALGNPMLPIHRGELQSLGLGLSVEVFDQNGQPIQQARGELVCTKPFPCMPVKFWDDPNNTKYRHAYFDRFPGVWAHGDYAEITAQHGLIIYGRSDATLNPGGVRIGTAEIYRQVERIPEVLDSVVIGQDWHDDTRVILFVKLRPGFHLDKQLISDIRQTIRDNASPRHVPAKIIQVSDIPRTLNGKIVELAVRQVVHGEQVNNLDSLANPEALIDFKNREELRE